MTDQKDRTEISKDELLEILNSRLSGHPVTQDTLVALDISQKSVEQKPIGSNWGMGSYGPPEGKMGAPRKAAEVAYKNIIADLQELYTVNDWPSADDEEQQGQ